MVLLVTDCSGKTKVTDFHGTVLVDEAVRWFEVAMVNTSRMKIFAANQQVVKQCVDV